MAILPFSTNTAVSFAAAATAAVVATASTVTSTSAVDAASSTAVVTRQLRHPSHRELQLDLIPPEVLELIPPICKDGDDSPLNEAFNCATGNLFECFGLASKLGEFENLIPTDADLIRSCSDVADPFCGIAENCQPCIGAFESLTRCIVDNIDDVDTVEIDDSIVDLIDRCDLTCSANSQDINDAILIVDVNDNNGDDDDDDEPLVLDIPGAAIENGNFNTLVAALDAAGLVDTLSSPNGPYTVFAPDDDAFDNLPEGLVGCLLDDVPTLTDILLYHVAGGAVFSDQLQDGQEIPTLLGDDETVTVDITTRPNGQEAILLNDNSRVVQADVETSNGIIHVINNVLVPPSVDVAGYLNSCLGNNDDDDDDDDNTDDDEDDYTYDDENDGVDDILGDLIGGIGGIGGIPVGDNNNNNNDNEVVGGGNNDAGLGDLIPGVSGGGGNGGIFEDIVGDIDVGDAGSIGQAVGGWLGNLFGNEDVGNQIGGYVDGFIAYLFGGNSGDGSGWLSGGNNDGWFAGDARRQ